MIARNRGRLGALGILSLLLGCGGGGSDPAPVSSGLVGSFVTGQEADVLLSGIDFNNTGGPLLFNHPAGIASDGTRLLMADHFNNRVLIWNSPPNANEEPDLVLGQPDFTSNNPGSGLDRLDWPSGVVTDGARIVVADTYNDRLLIWNSWPTQNGQAADLSLAAGQSWGVWTDGQRLAATRTWGGPVGVMIWNSFPTQNDQPYDLMVNPQNLMGTPRTITSDGTSFIVSDHNASSTISTYGRGNFVWKTFPTQADAPYDFFMEDPIDKRGAWLQGQFAPDGRLIMIGVGLYVWNGLPAAADDAPDVQIGWPFKAGEPAGVTLAGGRVYVSCANGNKVVAYNSIPTASGQIPDFAIGSPDIDTNTLDTFHFITNGVPATDGTSLVVSSDFDVRVSIWKTLPTASGTYPDVTIKLQRPPWDNAIHGGRLAMAGMDTVYLWNSIPLDGRQPDTTFTNKIGSVQFKKLEGVAMDDHYVYLSDKDAGAVYVWKGIPSASSEPAYKLTVDQPRRLSSDGTYLAVTCSMSHRILVYRIADLGSNPTPSAIDGKPWGSFNLPESGKLGGGGIFVADTVFSRLWVWKRVEDAIAGLAPDAVLGEEGLDDKKPEIGKDKLFWPGAAAFDGTHLWVGEFKFSNRVVRFSPVGGP